MRRCSLLAALLYALTAAQVAVFVLALWQNGWQIESLQLNPLVRGCLHPPTATAAHAPMPSMQNCH
jgi:hypothetical protein